MNALSDVYLVVVLADFSALVEFAQRVWDQYFSVDNKQSLEDWEEWNAQQNEMNEFCKVSSLVSQKQETPVFKHAVDLMEHLSFQREIWAKA